MIFLSGWVYESYLSMYGPYHRGLPRRVGCAKLGGGNLSIEMWDNSLGQSFVRTVRLLIITLEDIAYTKSLSIHRLLLLSWWIVHLSPAQSVALIFR